MNQNVYFIRWLAMNRKYHYIEDYTNPRLVSYTVTK